MCVCVCVCFHRESLSVCVSTGSHCLCVFPQGVIVSVFPQGVIVSVSVFPQGVIVSVCVSTGNHCVRGGWRRPSSQLLPSEHHHWCHLAPRGPHGGHHSELRGECQSVDTTQNYVVSVSL